MARLFLLPRDLGMCFTNFKFGDFIVVNLRINVIQGRRNVTEVRRPVKFPSHLEQKQPL